MLINLPKRETGKPSNVTIRGVTPEGVALRPQVVLVEGRMFRPGTSEVVTGRSIATASAAPRSARRCASPRATGRSSACSTPGAPAFNSEIWGDAEQMLQAFRRTGYSSMLFRLDDADRFDAVKARDRERSAADARGEARAQFYADQSETLSKFISILGTVDLDHLLDRRGDRRDDHDVRERGVAHRRDRHAARARLHAHGDPDRVPGRGAGAGLVGGVVGLVGASFMQAITISTMNFQTFSELAFSFTLTPRHRRRCRSRSRWAWASSAASCRPRVPRG